MPEVKPVHNADIESVKKEYEEHEDWPETPGTDIDAGLTSEEATRLLDKYGRNEVVAPETPEYIKIGKRYLALIPIIMMLAAVLSIAVVGKCDEADDKDQPGKCECNELRDWASFILLIFELNLIVIVDYIGERNSGNAIRELKRMAAPEANVKRDNKWQKLPVAKLVPGDIVGLVIGAAVPADGILVGEGEPLKLDVAALTGEPLPETKRPGDRALAGSMVLSGELDMVVARTGERSTMGQAMSLIAGVTEQGGKLKRLLAGLARGIALGATFVCVILFFVKLIRDDQGFAEAFKFSVVILVAVLPVAMPVVVTTGLAVGALELSKHKAIVQRLSAIEEMAGMDILVSDKTGTLTLGKMSIDESSNVIFFNEGTSSHEATKVIHADSSPSIQDDYNQKDLMTASLLASRLENTDAIDTAINKYFDNQEAKVHAISNYEVTRFIPFDPCAKYTKAYVTDKTTNVKMIIVKGAPTVINALPGIHSDVRRRAVTVMDECASRGLKTLAVAVTTDIDSEMNWSMLGYLALLDPPRHDTEATIIEAQNRGVEVKMCTGDQRKIAIEIARRLHMKTNIFGPEIWSSGSNVVDKAGGLANLALSANGFAGVHPEHKYKVVEALQSVGHVVAMTGDGVNDAPALAISNVGIAVADSTDAARGAADLVLTEEGLSTIIHAINKSRVIFRRLESYIIYRLASSCLILGFFTLTTVALQFNFPVWVTILLSIINDFTVMATSKDNMRTSHTPLRWDVPKLSLIATTIGVIGIIQSFLLLYLLRSENHLFWLVHGGDMPDCRIVGCIYLNLALTIQLNIFSSRTKGFIFNFDEAKDYAPPPSKILMAPVLGACVGSTIIAVYWPATLRLGAGAAMRGIGWELACAIWIWVLMWFAIVEVCKVSMYKLNNRSGYQALFYGSLLDSDATPRHAQGQGHTPDFLDETVHLDNDGEPRKRRQSQRNLGVRAIAADEDENKRVFLPEILPIASPQPDLVLTSLLAMREHILALESRMEALDNKEIHFKAD